ncbi:SdiA-regulated domain-containing protein [Pseudomonas sp.]|uniref:SdiA-regulated domain-containing protein n=1 Tax=Pseudomonas sp. TaxID=306 RepID=UPI00258E65C9|nr:SdiA-regulated domain-containing protein [Pseudomonas sp.]
MRTFIIRKWPWVITGILFLSLVVAGQNQRLFELAWFKLWASVSGHSEPSLNLADYRAEVQAQPIEGLADVSALTYDPERQTLFTVTNKQSELVELSLQGAVIRRIPLIGFGDPEGVEYIRPDTFVISDERHQRLLAVKVDDRTTSLNAADASQMVLNLGGRRNRGFEGLAFDRTKHRLFVANEQSPMTIYEVSGFPASKDSSQEIQIMQNAKRDADLFMTDLSSLEYDQRHDHLLALSDQSRLLVELGSDHKPLGTLLLRGGFHGLSQTVPQAEGVAMDDDDTIYLVSEPNLFYVFRK